MVLNWARKQAGITPGALGIASALTVFPSLGDVPPPAPVGTRVTQALPVTAQQAGTTRGTQVLPVLAVDDGTTQVTQYLAASASQHQTTRVTQMFAILVLRPGEDPPPPEPPADACPAPQTTATVTGQPACPAPSPDAL